MKGIAMDNSKLANQIRILAFSCKSKAVFSCEFGNEFNERVLKLLDTDIERIAKESWAEGYEWGSL